MHVSTFDNLKPTDDQLADLSGCRERARVYADYIDEYVPNGPDKTYLLRKFREVAMWVDIAITRNPDGSPKS